LRCMHESQMHEENCFITLTYDDEHLPKDHSLDVSHWQKFAKRLRKKVGPFRFYHCGEYGDKTLRPHYHACLFGMGFRDKKKFKKNKRGEWLFSSELLDKTWEQGFTTVGALTYESAEYVTRYILKNITGDMAEDEYTRTDKESGKVFQVKPPYVTMSRGGRKKGAGGIGASWLDKFHSDVYPSDEVVVSGRRFRPPRFYDEQLDGEVLEQLKRKRLRAADLRKEDLSPERLKVREKCLELNMDSRLKRRI